MSHSNEGICIPDDFICPITQTIMEDPLMTKDGFCFERAAILEWIYKNGTCPLTRRPLASGQLVRNHALQNRIRHWCSANMTQDDLVSAASDQVSTTGSASSVHLRNIRKMVTLARQSIGSPAAELVCA